MIQAKVFNIDYSLKLEKEINDFLKNNTPTSVISLTGNRENLDSKLIVFYQVEKQ